MNEIERDPVTGENTTGHVWNGLTELDTPVPRGILIFAIVTHMFALLWWILMPSFPVGSTFLPGVLGVNQQVSANQAVMAAQASRAVWIDPLMDMSEAEVLADEALTERVMETGERLFGDNCAACHGRDAQGGIGYPDLTDDDWIWGDGSVATIADTITVGVNATHDETRFSQMPAFGTQQMLQVGEIRNVARYVYSLSKPQYSTTENLDRIQAGQETFATNCAGCHGADATGTPAAGAPNLTDAVWIYGGELENIIATVHGGRVGHMPTWDERLSVAQIKILALYVHSLGTETP